jgi:hypothetical protein
MKHKLTLTIAIFLMPFTWQINAKCSLSKKLWRMEISQSRSIEQFFIDNYSCKKEFYRFLSGSEKIYFDTVLYPYGLNKNQYVNRWLAIAYSDSKFFNQFTFFNNYFATHKDTITTHQLHCFQKQLGFEEPIEKKEFYKELQIRKMMNDVSYLYPLIRWSYENRGIDMNLSAKRVKIAKKRFGVKIGEIGDNEQFARYIALFNFEYSAVAKELSRQTNINEIDAYKLLVVLTYLESRGNIFAISSTGAFGALQLTMHYYMLYGEPNNPFNPKSSIIKLANKFIHYNHIGKSLNESVIAYKSGSLTKCQNNSNINDVDCRYYNDFKRYMYEMRGINSKGKISRYLTGKNYISVQLDNLKRSRNPNGIKYYEPYQYAILKSNILKNRAKDSMYITGGFFKSLGRMKRSDIYYLQDKYGISKVGVISDKKVCY